MLRRGTVLVWLITANWAAAASAQAVEPATLTTPATTPATAPTAAVAAPDAPQVAVGAAPAWVVPITLTAPASSGGLVIRLLDAQVRVEGDTTYIFQRNTMRISSQGALQAATNVALGWRPENGVATVHTVRIHRDGAVIDLLAKGAKFTTIRQEAALGAGQVNGVLTAFLPISDIRVGDEIEFAYTISQREPNLPGRVELEYLLTPGAVIDQANIRLSWPENRPLRIAFGQHYGAVKPQVQNGSAVFNFARTALNVPRFTPDSPTSLINKYAIHLTNFSSWEQVSQNVQPLFAATALLNPDSPLRAEVARIAAGSGDPVARASAALALVQKDVRYFAELNGLGNYRPAPADQVWERRIGDCKGKTVLLLALLHELGITAVPALVSTDRHNHLQLAQPGAGRFNHVIVKATIAGQDYWLDGTLPGGAPLDRIETPSFEWALPLVADGAKLEPIPTTPFRLPQTEFSYDIDATAGIDQPAKVKAQTLLRGSEAAQLAQTLDLMDQTQRDEALRSFWRARHDAVTVTTAERQTLPTGELALTMTGTQKLNWGTTGDRPTFHLQTDAMQLGINLISDRRSPPTDPAMVIVQRRNMVMRQTILLPDDGKGFSIEGDPIDETIGTIQYRRSATLVGNRFEAVASTVSGQTEVPVAAALAADERSDDLFERTLYLRLPAANAASAVTKDNAEAANAALAELIEAGKLDQARSLIDARVAGNPRDAGALAQRGMLAVAAGRLDLAGRDFDAALAIDRATIAAIEGKARLLLARDQTEDALLLYDRAILLEPERGALYAARGLIREIAGDPDGALSDYDIALGKAPGSGGLRYRKVVALIRTGKPDEAAAFARKLLDQNADNLQAMQLLVRALAAQNQPAAARKLVATALAAKPQVGLYQSRLFFDLHTTADERLADLLAIVALAPVAELAPHTLAALAGDAPRLAKLRAAYRAATAQPGADAVQIGLRAGRIALLEGDSAELETALSALVAGTAVGAELYNQACWERGTLNVGIAAGRQACDAALRDKRHSYYVDSLGLIELRSGNHSAALKLYDEATPLLWDNASTAFARGLTRQRLGDAAGAKRDFDRARIINPEIDRTFASYGLRP